MLEDCDDSDASTHPYAAENEDNPAECMTDADEDGFGDENPSNNAVSGTDCDDSNSSVNPAATNTNDNCSNSGSQDLTYDDILPAVSSCLGCHSQSSASGNYVMTYATTVGVASDDVPSMSLVEPGDSENSYLWHKLNGTHQSVGGAGSQMPLSGSPLSAAELSVVETWINDGANP